MCLFWNSAQQLAKAELQLPGKPSRMPPPNHPSTPPAAPPPVTLPTVGAHGVDGGTTLNEETAHSGVPGRRARKQRWVYVPMDELGGRTERSSNRTPDGSHPKVPGLKKTLVHSILGATSFSFRNGPVRHAPFHQCQLQGCLFVAGPHSLWRVRTTGRRACITRSARPFGVNIATSP